MKNFFFISKLLILVSRSFLCLSPTGAGEQIRKKETVHCPVCRTSWQYPLPSLSLSPSSQLVTQPFLPVSVPMGSGEAGEGGLGGLRLKSLSSSHVHLTGEKAVMVEKIKKVYSCTCINYSRVSETVWKHKSFSEEDDQSSLASPGVRCRRGGRSPLPRLEDSRDDHHSHLA